MDVHGGAVPSLGSGTGTRVSRKSRGRLPGSWGCKTMAEAQSWQTFQSLFIAALHRNKKDQYLLVAESIILHERH